MSFGIFKSFQKLYFPMRFKHLSYSQFKYFKIKCTNEISCLQKECPMPLFNSFRHYSREISFKGPEENDLDEELIKDNGIGMTRETLPRSLRISGMPHNVLIIQPAIKWGPKKNKSTAELKSDEAISLIHTLPSWKVFETKIISVTSYDKKELFNKGQLQNLIEYIGQNKQITAVFINLQTLKNVQHLFLEQVFRVPVYDRYNIIINIFKHHAKSKEAKLQVALAEVPYMFSRIKGVHGEEISSTNLGSSEMSTDKRLLLLSEREHKLKNAIQKLRKNRDLLRNKRKSLNIPVVAVVGYTNAGKTSLIKALTGKDELEPENKLFATLDVTVHPGFLPRNLKVLFIDTIGFISDIPTNLLEPFVSTLEDAIQADLIMVVRDISNPNYAVQNEVVLSTLKSFNLNSNTMENIIFVDNKCDKIEINQEEESDKLFVSCTTGLGIDVLRDKLEEAVIKATDMLKLTFRVTSGGEEFSWLLKETSVYHIDVDPKNQQYCFLSVLITTPNLNIFKKKFIAQK